MPAKGEDGRTALLVATRWARPRSSELLRERGADAVAVSDADRALGAYVAGADTSPPRADVRRWTRCC